MSHDKAAARAAAKARRAVAHAAEGAASGAALAAADLAALAPHWPCAVSAFLAIGEEIDTLPLIEKAIAAGCTVGLPVIERKAAPLLFRRWAPGEPLDEKAWGIREPLPAAALVEPDLLLVPLLAFDATGFRLGYGGGFYDRTLARLRAMKRVVAVGVAYDAQRVDAVPRDRYDEPLDWVLTPSGLVRCSES
ncbi:MAG: 5-formyltetrahydrofolate cyclo-ligase [Pseudomonadota bacterium]